MLQKEHAVPSPFPGMDPYLEGYLWPDVHQALAAKIRQQLAPRYVTRLGLAVLSDEPDEAEVKIMYPDIEVLRGRRVERSATPGIGSVVIAPPTLAAPLVLPRLDMRVPHIE